MNPAAAENRRIVNRKQMGASMLEEQTQVEVLVSRPLTSTHKPRRYPRIAVLGLRESMAWVVRELRVLDTVVRLVVNMELVIVVRFFCIFIFRMVPVSYTHLTLPTILRV